jgi:hypothetical protein
MENDDSIKLEKRLAQWLKQAAGTQNNRVGKQDNATFDRMQSLGSVR